MKPRISVITLGVDDLERSFAFYRDGLGLQSDGIIGKEFEYGAVAFFRLEGGARLAIWPRTSLARDCGLPLAARSATDVALGHNVASRKAVDAVMKQAADAGARVVNAAADTFYGGYAGAGARVLVMDDEEPVRRLAERAPWHGSVPWIRGSSPSCRAATLTIRSWPTRPPTDSAGASRSRTWRASSARS